MPPSKEESPYSISTSSRSSSKRKLQGEIGNQTSTQNSSRSPTFNNQSESDTASFQPTSTSTKPKRLKTSNSSGNLGSPAEMSKSIGKGARSKVIDLTKPPNFQPHTGAKRLVIKNLRTTSRKDVDEYYDRTWDELDNALACVFSRKEPGSPLEVLCRGVEMTCRRGRAEVLFINLKEKCKLYIEKTLLPDIEKQCGSSPVDALRTVHKRWTVWNEQSVSIQWTSFELKIYQS